MSREAGQKLQAEGQEQVMDNQAAEWRADVAKVIGSLAASGREFTNDDVRELANLTGVGQPTHPNAWGASISAARKRNEIELVGYRTSTQTSRHAGVNRVWRGAN
tara:strand:+ start:10222 stop:10536 length:315 start_codon:yes stop_codon:yes gene_type:complete